MDMDMGSMTMATSTATSSAAAPTKTGMGMGGGSGCKISMLWNWYTVDSCFIASTWHVTSRGMFAGSCIGVICLVITLEFLRRSVKEYDRYLIRKHISQQSCVVSVDGQQDGPSSPKVQSQSTSASPTCVPGVSQSYRPNVLEQAIRALLHMLQFAVAYFIMLLAMYYNGYVIICIFIGAYIGSFIFHWEPLGGSPQTSASKEATVCCG
ncbi:Ctr-domain-containing protein [Xylariaceae sp. FL0662B]|nr:Ctr-domain-containing protein [Xylariaceae sp. FL0662B]